MKKSPFDQSGTLESGNSVKNIRVVVTGRPNVGKSSIINAITNSHLKVGNFAGVTVDKSEVYFRQRTQKDGSNGKNKQFLFVDLPGTYSLNPASCDEEVTCEVLSKKDYDVILHVVDGHNVQGGMMLAYELAMLGKPILIAVNFCDEIDAPLDTARMQKLTNMKFILCSAKNKTGMRNILVSLDKIGNGDNYLDKISLPQELLEEVEKLTKTAKHEFGITSKHFGLKLLFGESQTLETVKSHQSYHNLLHIIDQAKSRLKQFYTSQTARECIINAIADFVDGLHYTSKSKKGINSRDNRIDSILLHKLFGMPIFLGIMWSIFWVSFNLGQYPIGYLDQGLSAVKTITATVLGSGTFSGFFVDGLMNGVGSIMLFVPNIFLIFTMIAILEKTGYMARIAFLLDGLFNKFGLNGKSFIPLMTGIGCSIPAYLSTRILRNKAERLTVMVAVGFIPCSAKLVVFSFLCGAFFSPNVAGSVLFAIYCMGIVVALLCSLMMKKFAFSKQEADLFAMEMPIYRIPSVKNVLFTGYKKSLDFLKNASTLIALSSIFIWSVSYFPNGNIEESYLSFAGKFLQPVFSCMDFDWKVVVSLISGLLAKEVVISTMSVLYHAPDTLFLAESLRNSMSFASAVALITFIFFYVPCISAVSVFHAETKRVMHTIGLVVFTTFIAYFISYMLFFCVQMLSYI